MSKIVLADLPSGFASTQALNQRFGLIEEALNQDVVWRSPVSGEGNAMGQELDLGSNKIVNLADGVNDKDAVNIGQVENLIASTAGSIITDLGLGLGNVLGSVPAVVDNDVVLFNGVTGRQIKSGGQFQINTFAALATTAAPIAGMLVYLRQHTSGGLGGGWFQDTSGTIVNDGGTIINNTITTGRYWKRVHYSELTLEMFGVLKDGTDESSKFQLAANKNLPIRLTPGTVKINSVVTSASNLILIGSGDSCVLDVTSVTGNALYNTGALSALPAINNVLAGARSITFVSTHGLTVGDKFLIYNPTDSSFSGFRTYYRAGEWCEVKGVSGLTVTLKSPLYAAYTGASVNNYKVTSGITILKDFKIAGGDAQIEIAYGISPLVQNVTMNCVSNTALYFNKCWAPSVELSRLHNVGVGADDYAVVFGCCQHGRVTNSDLYSRRHACTTGGDAAVGCVPTRDIRVRNTTLRNDYDSGVWPADFHGNTEDSSYENCTIYGGVSWQGKNVHYRSCTIYAMKSGMIEYAGEILGGNFSLVDCDFITTEDPSAVTRGIIDVGGNSSVLTANTTSDVNFIVKGCRLNGSNLSAVTSLVLVRLNGSTVKVNIEVNDLQLAVNNLGQIVYAAVVSGSTSPDRLIVDNICGGPTALLLANPSGGFATAPMRMQRCGATVNSTTTSGSPSKAVNITFKYSYPKAPIVQVTKGAANYNGNRVGVMVTNSATPTGANIGLYTDDATNFSVSTAFDFNWQAGIYEV